MGWYSYYNWRPYVPVAARRRQAARRLAQLRKAGREVAPVEIAGRRIATTFWGDAWCDNLEAYSDYANRLPRGRTYVRNGSVIDLQIEAGRVEAIVSGSDLYEVAIAIKPLAEKRWGEIKRQCAGQIDSLVELLRGSISRGVMEVVTREGEGLFPSPREISFSCSCPDWATMCKHVAATLYGTGARLDHEPELLFTLRGVDPTEMVEVAIDQPAPGGTGTSRRGRVLETDELSAVFGVDIEMSSLGEDPVEKPVKRKAVRKKAARKKGVKKKPARKKAARKKGVKKKPARKKAARKKPVKKKAVKKKPARKKPASKKAKKKAAKKKVARKKAARKKTTTRKKKAATRRIVVEPIFNW